MMIVFVRAVESSVMIVLWLTALDVSRLLTVATRSCADAPPSIVIDAKTKTAIKSAVQRA